MAHTALEACGGLCGGPSVVTASACVSPRVNSAQPWVRGRKPPARLLMGRTSAMDLPRRWSPSVKPDTDVN
jgi:hypothetical protein